MSAPYTKTIICLANSRKPPIGWCIAGREVIGCGFGSWVRAISVRSTHEISWAERRYENDEDPSLLDLISIPMLGGKPYRHQRENQLIDAECRWIKMGTMTWPALQSAIDNPAGPLWLNGTSSQNGCNDRVPEGMLDRLYRSLYLIRPEQLKLVVRPENAPIGQTRRRVRAKFNLSGHRYCIPVTDPLVEISYLGKSDGEYALDKALMCVSLGEPFYGYAYKLAAAIITPLY